MTTLKCPHCGSPDLEKKYAFTFNCRYCSSVIVIPFKKLAQDFNIKLENNINLRPEPKLEILQIHPVPDTIGNVYFIGSCINAGQLPLGMSRIKVMLKDENDKEITTIIGYTSKTSQLPEEQSTFCVSSFNSPEFHDFSVTTEPVDAQGFVPERAEICIHSHSLDFGDMSSEYILSGVLQNNEDFQLEHVEIFSIVYDEETLPIAQQQSILSDVEPGEERKFTLYFNIYNGKPGSYLIDTMSLIF